MKFKILQLTALLLIMYLLHISKAFPQGTLLANLSGKITFIVAQDGSGDYMTINNAINAVPNNSVTRTVIFVRNGTYLEKVEIPVTKTNLTIIGEDVNTTIISNNDYSGSGETYVGIDGTAPMGTSNSHTLYIKSNDFALMNITVENTAGNVGQAVALNSKGDRQFFYHCRILGYQDTYYTTGYGRYYLKDCYIEGATDYIFGRGVALFDSCVINSLKSGSYITAASTDQNYKYGYIFQNCKLTANAGITGVYLGRPWKAYAQTVYMNSDLGEFLNTLGWSIWNGNTNHTTCYYAEYKNCGNGSIVSNRASWSHQLTDTGSTNYALAKIFDKNVNPNPYAANWICATDTDDIYPIIKNNTNRYITSACFTGSPSLISITSPAKDTTVITGSFVTINATVTDADGSITLVEFYDGLTLLGSATTVPYSYPINNPSTGTHIITVKAADSNGGSTTSSPVTFTVHSATGWLNSLDYNVSAKVYPNPSKDKIYIETDINLENADLKLIDVMGTKIIVPIIITNKNATADISRLSAGIYTLLIVQENLSIRRKITVMD